MITSRSARVSINGVFFGTLSVVSVDGVVTQIHADGSLRRLLTDALRKKREAEKDASAIVVEAEVVPA